MNSLKIHKNECPVSVGKSGGSLYALTNFLKITPKNLSVMRFELPVNRRIGLHYHPNDEECYYILGGYGEAIIKGESYPLHPDDFIYIPMGSPHELKNSGEEPLILIAIFSSPNGLEKTNYMSESDVFSVTVPSSE